MHVTKFSSEVFSTDYPPLWSYETGLVSLEKHRRRSGRKKGATASWMDAE